jgi:hypothetical protein
MAVHETTRQMALARDTSPGSFMERVVAMMTWGASKVLTEKADTPYHQGRAEYAQRVVQNPAGMSVTAGPQVVMHQTIKDTTTYDEGTMIATCTATDLQLQTVVASLWNALAGLNTPA